MENGVPTGALTDLTLYNPATGAAQTFVSNASGLFNVTVSTPGTYDVVISRHANGNSYEWYQKRGVSVVGNINIEPYSIYRQQNADNVILVPADYTTIQEAVDHIQSGGTVHVSSGSYGVSGLHWRYKHIHLQGTNTTLSNIAYDGMSAIRLDWSGINNQDVIMGFEFEDCFLSGNDATDIRGSAIVLLNGAAPQITSCDFTNNKIEHLYNNNLANENGVGGAVFVGGTPSQTYSPIFTGCDFTGNWAISANGGGAVALYGRAQFIGCTFSQNRTDQWVSNPSPENAGGAIIIYTQANSGDIIFDTCQFTDNKGMKEAHDVYVAGCPNMNQIKFDACTFNWSSPDMHYYRSPSIKFLPAISGSPTPQNAGFIVKNSKFLSCDAGAVLFSDYRGSICFNFTRNIVANNSALGYGFRLNYYGDYPTDLERNYFVFDNNTISNINGDGLVLSHGYNYIVNNTIFDNCSSHGINWGGDQTNGTENLVINNCFFQPDTHTYHYVDFVGNAVNTLTTSELQFAASPNLNSGYVPIWNTTVKSPCIDNGNPDTNGINGTWYVDLGDRDSDGTPLDIGAISLIDGHVRSIQTINHHQIKWISFPGVINYAGHDTDNTLQYVFDTYEGNLLFSANPPVLDVIKWIYNDNYGTAEPGNVPNQHVCSQNGYKVKLLNNQNSDKIIEYTGFRPGKPLNAGMYLTDLSRWTTKNYVKPPVVNTENCAVDDNTGVLYRTTYLGYYLEQSMEPFDALLPILNNIIEIKAEDWALVREPVLSYQYMPGDLPSDAYTNNWLGVQYGPCAVAVNPGEMLEIKYIGTSAAEFKWGGENPDPPFTDNYTRKMPSHFGYEEQPGYIPIFLTIDMNQYEEGNKPLEVAVFVDDECKGAAVVKEGQVQLNAYIMNEPDAELKDLVFQMYFPGKSNGAKVASYAYLNNKTGRYVLKNATIADCKGFLRVNLGTVEEIPLPACTMLKGNFPNPFNPETVIQFDLTKTGITKLEVFNVKGQIVKTLVKGNVEAGSHSIYWNGKDDSGISVASGVYFYRLTTKEKCLTNKMLLLK